MIDEYKGTEHHETMKKLPMNVVMGARVFLQFRERIIESYPELFDGSGDHGSATSNFGTKWGWYSSLYRLASGDISKFDVTAK